MKNSTNSKAIASFLIVSATLLSCKKEMDGVNSENDMILFPSELTVGFQEQQFSIGLESVGAWHLEDRTGKEWLNTEATAGTAGKSTISLSCTENNEAKSRTGYVRFQLDGIYPEYRSLTVIQTGKPAVSTQPFSDVTDEAITLQGSCTYEGEIDFIEEYGFTVLTEGSDNETTVSGTVLESEDKKATHFSGNFPVESGKHYTVKAYVKDTFGNVFTSGNEEELKISFSFGKLACSGSLRAQTETKEFKLLLPYYYGDGQSYTLSATCSDAALTTTPVTLEMLPEGGIIEIPVKGTPAETGEVTFTVNGLPAFITESLSVKAVVKNGGKNQLIYLEDFGAGEEGKKTVENPNYLRKNQPAAEYTITGEATVRDDGGPFKPYAGYEWASAKAFMNLKKSKGGTPTTGGLEIRHLDFSDATNIKMDFGANTLSMDDLMWYYSNDKGESWSPLTWTATAIEGQDYQLCTVTTEITGSADFWLKCDMKSQDDKAKRFDDVRITGDYE